MVNPAPGNSFQGAINDWYNAQNEYEETALNYKQELQDLLAKIKAHKIDPGTALYLFTLTCLPMETNAQEFHMQQESDALNIANALRSKITNSQDAYNQVINNIQGGGGAASGCAAACALNKDLNSLRNLLETPGLNCILGASNLQGINCAINNIQDVVLPSNAKGNTDGSKTYNVLKSMYNAAVNQGQSVPTGLNTIQSNYQNMNQSVSGVSSYIQTQLNFLNQNLQQYFSAYSNFFSDFNTLASYIVSKSSSA